MLIGRSIMYLVLFQVSVSKLFLPPSTIWAHLKAAFIMLVRFTMAFLGNCFSISPDIKSYPGGFFDVHFVFNFVLYFCCMLSTISLRSSPLRSEESNPLPHAFLHLLHHVVGICSPGAQQTYYVAIGRVFFSYLIYLLNS